MNNDMKMMTFIGVIPDSMLNSADIVLTPSPYSLNSSTNETYSWMCLDDDKEIKKKGFIVRITGFLKVNKK
jgi:hypothetical protein